MPSRDIEWEIQANLFNMGDNSPIRFKDDEYDYRDIAWEMWANTTFADKTCQLCYCETISLTRVMSGNYGKLLVCPDCATIYAKNE